MPSVYSKIERNITRIDSYLLQNEPKGNTLILTSIIGSGIATVFGTTALLPIIGLHAFEPLLEVVGVAASGVAGVTSGVYKARNLASQTATAQKCRASLLHLRDMFIDGRIKKPEANFQIAEIVKELSFIGPEASPQSHEDDVDLLAVVKGEIHTARLSDSDGKAIVCSGSVSGLHRNHRLWLFVESNGKHWPKGAHISVNDDGTWKMTIFEDGTPGTEFEIGLWVVTMDGNNIIWNWLRQGAIDKSYSSLKDLDEANRLARINATALQKPESQG